MSIFKKIPPAIQWHEGMLLSPQHFQQFSIRQDGLLNYHFSHAVPYYWGVVQLEIDSILLITGVLRISDLEAIMPDGLVIHHQAGDEVDLELSLEQYVEAIKASPQTVHLAIAPEKSDSASSAAKLIRYESIDGPPVVDLNTGDGEMTIPRLKPKLQLLVAETPPSKYVTIPLCQIEYRNDVFALTSFIPPLVQVTKKSEITKMVTPLATLMREKTIFLSDKVRMYFSELGPLQALETRFAIQNLSSSLPALETYLHSGTVHPFTFYSLLTEIAGKIAALGHSYVPPSLPPYDHHKLRLTFEEVLEYIFRMIDEGILEQFLTIPFYLENDIFSLMFDKSWADKELVIGVRGRKGSLQEEISQWIESSIIGSKSKTVSLRDRRILGANRFPYAGSDEIITQSYLLYTLEFDSENIVAGEMLQIINLATNVSKPTEIVLYVKNI